MVRLQLPVLELRTITIPAIETNGDILLNPNGKKI
jgi:hypothetical protein